MAGLAVCGFFAATQYRQYFTVPSIDELELGDIKLTPSGPPCLVTPLPGIEDASALAFENGLVGGAGTVDVENLTTATARALARFEKVVTSKGGTIKVTSAYRPPAYQQHLQVVWDKWINELRDNHEPSCAHLKIKVAREFTRHGLLETQRPVNVSDHTRGLAFDAAVILPAVKKRGARFSLDRLARLCTLMRPDVRRDPVHFRFALARRSRPAPATRGPRVVLASTATD